MRYEMNTCPYCGQKTKKSRFSGKPCWICDDCQCLFTEEDAEREDIRHKVSAILMDTDEQHPIECDITVGEHKAQGLSSLELPNIVKCFQMPNDGTLWFHEEGAVESDLKTEKWTVFDDYDIYDQREILKGLL